MTSGYPETIGKCRTNLGAISVEVNKAQRRLILAGGETGWWGTWNRITFNVSQANPFVTLPFTLARIINLTVCDKPINLRNEFYELMPAGPGIPNTSLPTQMGCGQIEGHARGAFPTNIDISPTNQKVRVYISDVRDRAVHRILIKGKDQNGNGIYSTDAQNTVDGFYITFDTPFADSAFQVSQITGIVKDPTFGDVILKQVDVTTGVEVTLARYTPDEIAPAYQRYFITKLPSGCCPPASTATVQLTAMAKLEFVPALRPSDFLLIGNIEAIGEEMQALRYSVMDVPNAAQLSTIHHRRAIRLLQDEMRHYVGEQHPAITVDVMQGAPLERQGIGTLI